jgi:hypothetical protein
MAVISHELVAKIKKDRKFGEGFLVGKFFLQCPSNLRVSKNVSGLYFCAIKWDKLGLPRLARNCNYDTYYGKETYRSAKWQVKVTKNPTQNQIILFNSQDEYLVVENFLEEKCL